MINGSTGGVNVDAPANAANARRSNRILTVYSGQRYWLATKISQ
jgi:hypothetical protein